ncbi:hypothetical protein KSP39_PZI007372 [Platanthera zijinensis]|uniref:Spermatogenesis-associated protein 20-like TRX domain-containing protein n=1 Tax=Platanthera zijinensis TaxID=2320716 RepID=A0AAP0BQV9_9ASPA
MAAQTSASFGGVSSMDCSLHSGFSLLHAHTQVDWYPWGTEAFEKARKRDVPIFLSISFIPLCHVMEVESFENEEISRMLNEWFVSIKVDREERPDVDKVYMSYVQALYGGGGWPLSVFLSPDLKPFMGGTYFPPDDNYGRPGFKTVLGKVKEAWESKRDILQKGGAVAIEQLSEALSATASSRRLSDQISQDVVKLCSEQVTQHTLVAMVNCLCKSRYQLSSRYDPKFGGFGSAPKFPRPVEICLLLYESNNLLRQGREDESNKNMEMVAHTLQCMARGGIHDHLGGGFHRYSVDECWHVPHFEKMLYDQGQLANVYLDTFTITKDVFYSSVARDILDYLKRDMIEDDGQIFSADDADSAETDGSSKKKEGAFYVWTSEEVEEVLEIHAELFKSHYYVKASGNCDLSRMSDPHKEFKGKNVLFERKDVSFRASKFGMSIDEYAQILGVCRQKLFDARSYRPRPHLDDKVIVSWNGLAISAFARASIILKEEPIETKFHFPVLGYNPNDYLEVAERAAFFIKSKLYDANTKRLQHSFRNGPSSAPGFLDDYAFLISALLDLYECGGRISWLAWAIKLQATQDDLFLDAEGGGYFNTPGEDPSILLRVKEDYDGAEPSGNSVSAINLIRLSSMLDDKMSEYYRQKAEHLLAVFENRFTEQSIAVPLMCCAADMFAVPSRRQVVLVGDKCSKEFKDMISIVYSSYDPFRTVIQIDPQDGDEMIFWESNNRNIFNMAKGSPPDKVAVAHVCQNFMCTAPVTDPVALSSLMSKPRGTVVAI